jgi:triosephosphate isomerase
MCDHGGAGAFTGEVSGKMLLEFGCRYVIVGHSERRHIYGESNKLVARKFATAQDIGLCPILCVGETLDEREAEATEHVLAQQLDAVMAASGIDAFEQAVIAYEPVWAIGTGRTATPAQAQVAHAFIRAQLMQHAPEIARKVRILYGGSVKADNARALFAQSDVDGGLIGGASLDSDAFLKICSEAEAAATAA